MDYALLACCVSVGCCVFVATYLMSGGRNRSAAMPRLHEDPLESLAARVLEIPPVARMAQRAVVVQGRAECLRQMPNMLDVVTLGLSAGLSFDSSLELYCGRYDNHLSRLLATAMLTWRLGTASRDEALCEAAQSLDVASFDRFVAVVSQALAFGSPLASTLEQQAQVIRDEQRAQMEEEIERVPIKMLIPLGTLIVPAMLLAILGPLLGASIALG